MLREVAYHSLTCMVDVKLSAPTAQVAQAKMSPGTFKVLTSLIRTLNNILGGISFVVLAKVFGVQSSQGDEKKDVEKGTR